VVAALVFPLVAALVFPNVVAVLVIPLVDHFPAHRVLPRTPVAEWVLHADTHWEPGAAGAVSTALAVAFCIALVGEAVALISALVFPNVVAALVFPLVAALVFPLVAALVFPNVVAALVFPLV